MSLLETIKTRGNWEIQDSGSATIVRDDSAGEVWDVAKASHVAGGSTGEEIQAHALSTEITALNDLTAAQVNAEVVDALATAPRWRIWKRRTTRACARREVAPKA